MAYGKTCSPTLGWPATRPARQRAGGRRDRAVLPGAADRPGDDRLQHAAGVAGARFRDPGGAAAVAVGVRRDVDRAADRGRAADERRVTPRAGEGGLQTGGLPAFAPARPGRTPLRRRAVRAGGGGPPQGGPPPRWVSALRRA